MFSLHLINFYGVPLSSLNTRKSTAMASTPKIKYFFSGQNQRIALIGNGFDLAHGYKTKYISFMRDVIDSNIADNSIYSKILKLPKSYNGFEQVVELCLVATNNFQHRIHHVIFNKLFIDMLGDTSLNKWCNIEQFYFDKLMQCKSTIQAINLNLEFEEIKKALEFYLSKKREEINSIEDLNYLFKGRKIEHVINFNYTNTHEQYLNNQHVLNIHGELQNIDNPIIFGYSPSRKDYQKLLEKNHPAYVENVKEFEYNNIGQQDELDNIMLRYNDKYDLFIMGHSCDLCDGEVLNYIFTSDSIENIYIFYHNKLDYKIKLQNISRIMKSKGSSKKVVSFPKSYPMPQFVELN